MKKCYFPSYDVMDKVSCANFSAIRFERQCKHVEYMEITYDSEPSVYTSTTWINMSKYDIVTK